MTDTSVDYEALIAEVSAESAEWNPAPGEICAGTVRAIRYIQTKAGRSLPVLDLTLRDGSGLTVGAGRTVLANRLSELKVQPGDAVAIKYVGIVAAKNNGRDFHDYRVSVARVGDRKPLEAFKVPSDDLGLVADATDSGW